MTVTAVGRWRAEQRIFVVSSPLYSIYFLYILFLHNSTTNSTTIASCNRLAIVNINAIDWTASLVPLKVLRRRITIDFLLLPHLLLL